MVTEDDRVKVLDVGLAKLHEPEAFGADTAGSLRASGAATSTRPCRDGTVALAGPLALWRGSGV